MMSFLPTAAAGVVSFAVTALLGFWIIPLLKRLKLGQTILEIGPRWHEDKEGTPTMGGFLFIIGIVAGVIAGFVLLRTSEDGMALTNNNQELLVLIIGLIMALAFGFIGFVDDYIKVARKQNEGLTEGQKLVFQFAIAIFYLVGLHFVGGISTIVEIPFLGQLDLKIFYYPIMVLGIVYMVNAVNLTDGIDGLCGSVTLVTALGFILISGILKFSGMQMISAALAGGCLGFLVWNVHPAKVFMGDTGSFFLGGMVIAIVFGLGIPVFVLLMGMVYIIEAVTMLIQRFYFKYTRKKYGEGRRIFRMTPIHHHFELVGWNENKIVLIFSGVQALFVALAVLAALYML